MCQPIGYYASYENLPLLPMSCVGEKLSDKESYDTLIRVASPFNKLGNAMVNLFIHYKWQSAVALLW